MKQIGITTTSNGPDIIDYIANTIKEDYVEYPDSFVHYEIINKATGRGVSIYRSAEYVTLYPLQGMRMQVVGELIYVTPVHTSTRSGGVHGLAIDVIYNDMSIGEVTFSVNDAELTDIEFTRKLLTEKDKDE